MPLKYKNPFEAYNDFNESISTETKSLQKKVREGVIPLRDSLLETSDRYILLAEGRGSGKSYFMGQYLIYKALDTQYQGKVFLCTREYQNSLSESVYTLIQDVIFDLELQEYFKFTKEYILCILTGVRFIFRGMQKIASLKSLVNIAIIAIEEAEAVTTKHMEYVIPLLRKVDTDLAKVIIALNPYKPIDDVISFCNKQLHVSRHEYNIFDLPEKYRDPILLEQAEADKIDPDLYSWKWLGSPHPNQANEPFTNISLIDSSPELKNEGVCYIDPSFMGGDYTAMTIVNLYENDIIVHGYLFKQAHDVCTPKMAKIIKSFPTKLRVYYEKNSIGDAPRKNFTEHGVIAFGIKNTKNKAQRIATISGSIQTMNKLKFVNSRENMLYNKELKNYNSEACLRNKAGFSDDAADSLEGALRYMNKLDVYFMEL